MRIKILCLFVLMMVSAVFIYGQQFDSEAAYRNTNV